MRDTSLIIALAFTLFHAATNGATPTKNETIPEYFVFDVPDLSLTGPARLSWFVLREGFYWDGVRFADLRNISWPSWDKKQVPPTVAPSTTPARLVLFTKDRTKISESSLERPFSPETFQVDTSRPPAFYQVIASLFDGRVEASSPLYPWPTRKPILSCDSAATTELARERALATCVATLRGYLENSPEIQDELYLRLFLPAAQGRSERRIFAELERDLRAIARRRGKTVYLSEKTKDKTFRAELGLTRTELLPRISLERESWPDTEAAMVHDDKTRPARELYSSFAEDGSGLKIFGYYTDATQSRLLESPPMGNRRVQVQFVAGEARTVRIGETRSPEIRTGLRGWLRPWRAELSSSYNQLSSGRGDTSAVLSSPGISLALAFPERRALGYFQFEKGFVRTGPSLEITELKTGAMKSFDVLGGSFLSAGFHQYGLAGTNTGANRLGSLIAGTIGVARGARFERWFTRAKGDLLFGSSQSLDLRLELGQIAPDGLLLGTFAGYSYYRGFAANKLGTRELFTESRFQLGVSIGWGGPDTVY